MVVVPVAHLCAGQIGASHHEPTRPKRQNLIRDNTDDPCGNVADGLFAVTTMGAHELAIQPSTTNPP